MALWVHQGSKQGTAPRPNGTAGTACLSKSSKELRERLLCCGFRDEVAVVMSMLVPIHVEQPLAKENEVSSLSELPVTRTVAWLSQWTSFLWTFLRGYCVCAGLTAEAHALHSTSTVN